MVQEDVVQGSNPLPFPLPFTLPRGDRSESSLGLSMIRVEPGGPSFGLPLHQHGGCDPPSHCELAGQEAFSVPFHSWGHGPHICFPFAPSPCGWQRVSDLQTPSAPTHPLLALLSRPLLSVPVAAHRIACLRGAHRGSAPPSPCRIGAPLPSVTLPTPLPQRRCPLTPPQPPKGRPESKWLL